MRQTLRISRAAKVDVWHLADCAGCDSRGVLFSDMTERDMWVATHEAGTGHRVDVATEIRIATP